MYRYERYKTGGANIDEDGLREKSLQVPLKKIIFNL